MIFEVYRQVDIGAIGGLIYRIVDFALSFPQTIGRFNHPAGFPLQETIIFKFNAGDTFTVHINKAQRLAGDILMRIIATDLFFNYDSCELFIQQGLAFLIQQIALKIDKWFFRF